MLKTYGIIVNLLALWKKLSRNKCDQLIVRSEKRAAQVKQIRQQKEILVLYLVQKNQLNKSVIRKQKLISLLILLNISLLAMKSRLMLLLMGYQIFISEELQLWILKSLTQNRKFEFQRLLSIMWFLIQMDLLVTINLQMIISYHLLIPPS